MICMTDNAKIELGHSKWCLYNMPYDSIKKSVSRRES